MSPFREGPDGTRSHSRDVFLQLARRGRRDQRPLDTTATRQVQQRLSPDDVDRLAAAYEAGGRTVELAKAFGIHRNTVQRPLKACGDVDLRRGLRKRHSASR